LTDQFGINQIQLLGITHQQTVVDGLFIS